MSESANSQPIRSSSDLVTVPTSEEQRERLTAAEVFEPGGPTKSFLYYTRKSPFQRGGIRFPGLVADAFRESEWLVLSTFVLEIIGIVVLSYGVWEESNWPAYLIAIGAGFLVVVDWVGAAFHHFKQQGKLCKRDNDLLLIFPEMRLAERRKLPYLSYEGVVMSEMPSGWRILSFFGVALIFLVMLVKIILLPAHVPTIWPPSIRWGVLGVSALTYLWIFWVHISHTGYYLAHLIYKSKVKSDKGRFNRHPDDYWKTEDEVEFDLSEFPELLKKTGHAKFANLVPSDAKLKEFLEQGVKTEFPNYQGVSPYFQIRKVGPHRYSISSLGMLYDSELDMMGRAQPNALADAAVALYGHYLQMRHLHAAHRDTKN